MNAQPRFPRLALAVAALALLLAAGCASRASRDDIRAALRQDPDLVLDVLRENPAALDHILAAMVANRQERLRQARRQAELATPLEPDLSGDRPALGAADAPVAMVAYSDFLCGHCARAVQTVHALLARHPGVRFVFKHFPHSRLAAELALTFEALGRQDPALAWRFHDEVFRRQRELAQDEGVLAQILSGLAPDRERLDADMRDPALQERLVADAREADRFGFDGTPSFVIGGVSLVGNQPLAQFEEVLGLVEKKGAAGVKDWAPSGGEACTDCPRK